MRAEGVWRRCGIQVGVEVTFQSQCRLMVRLISCCRLWPFSQINILCTPEHAISMGNEVENDDSYMWCFHIALYYITFHIFTLLLA